MTGIHLSNVIFVGGQDGAEAELVLYGTVEEASVHGCRVNEK